MNLLLAQKVGGRSNESPLTAKGQRQADALGRHFAVAAKHPGPELGPWFASTAVRAKDTAARALLVMQEPAHPVRQLDELLELSQGSWEGQLRDECYTPEVLAAIDADPWGFAAPGGESQRAVEERMMRAVQEVVLPAAEPGGAPAVIVTHGLAIKCFLRGVLGSEAAMTWRLSTDNTSITEVKWVEGGRSPGWRLLRVNDTPHLVLEGLSGP